MTGPVACGYWRIHIILYTYTYTLWMDCPLDSLGYLSSPSFLEQISFLFFCLNNSLETWTSESGVVSWSHDGLEIPHTDYKTGLFLFFGNWKSKLSCPKKSCTNCLNSQYSTNYEVLNYIFLNLPLHIGIEYLCKSMSIIFFKRFIWNFPNCLITISPERPSGILHHPTWWCR